MTIRDAVKQAAEQIRKYAQGTCEHSQNWKSFEEIAESIVSQTIDFVKDNDL